MQISNILSKVKLPKPVIKAGLKLRKHSPEIMAAVGTGLVIFAAVDACKQTIKAHDILENVNEEFDKIDQAMEVAGPEDYSQKDARNDRRLVMTNAGVKLVKIYGRPVILGATGLALILGAHRILHKRNAALTIAYSKLIAEYNKYRDKVVEAIGEEKEFQLRSGYSKEEIDYIDEDGNEKHVKNAKVLPGDGLSIYARIFDESCPNWSRNPSSNLTFLKAQQNFANDKLRCEGVLFLNDVYKMLGFPRTPEGQIVGWIWDPDNPEIDSYVDFGIHDKLFTSAAKRDFINGREPCVWLDFNVDGVVYDLI